MEQSYGLMALLPHGRPHGLPAELVEKHCLQSVSPRSHDLHQLPGLEGALL